MGAIGSEELINWEKMQGVGNGKEEKILVLVRLRPLSEKESSRAEVSDWECINSTTILYRNSLQERSGLPTAYSFDRVFRGDCTTREVYDECTKDIALSVVGGINSTIFAYGQTSSGKTYTMNGITDYAVADIYDYVQKHEERAFVLKFSAMEIYNEVVRDLLSTDNSPLRLLDDPERGTIIEKLTEETLRDRDHLKELLSICEVTFMLYKHLLCVFLVEFLQTIESSAREFIGKGNSTTLAASVNFVDLAGSERASQANSVGHRLKEGCHINRSLLTLSTVIRKLSKGRNGHVNYRDSKLTRILQPALGGNARTAIICNLSPARSHVEQSRNTLLFACCAKEVSTNAQVNVVMSDKALVKHLQKEVARLETELKIPASICDHAPSLRKKDMQIEKLEKEVRELKRQLNLANLKIEDLIQEAERIKSSKQLSGSFNENLRCNGELDLLLRENCEDQYLSDYTSYPSHVIKRNPIKVEENCDDIKEVRCIEMDESSQSKACESLGQSTSNNEQMLQAWMEPGSNGHIVDHEVLSASPRQVSGAAYDAEAHRVQDVRNITDSVFHPYPDSSSSGARSTGLMSSGSIKLSRSRSCRASLMTCLSDFETAEESQSTPPHVFENDFTGRPESGALRKHWKHPPTIYGVNNAKFTRSDSLNSDCSSFIDEAKNQSSSHGEEDIPTLGSFVAGLKEMAKLQYENVVEGTGTGTGTGTGDENGARDLAVVQMQDWPMKFEKLQKLIVELWHNCNVSLVHRTYFILLIKEDFTDSIYMEVEYRRLSFLKDTFSGGNSVIQDGRTLTLASRLMGKRCTEDERNMLYTDWGVALGSKRRRRQLVHLLYSDTQDMFRVSRSAAVVAKLIGFSENGVALKEMFGLSFTPPRMTRRSFSWKNSMSSLL
ncbi:hypothetical protein SASPL_126157 [Salvia splendens]|uniref:Kinesin-like protein n=1 Tax=Salvia splendens TaxID=180675 RepID=A0A8X8XLA9_SALSN|nr:hypothetical protein SASPL_126157 [Salvia splendens]